MFVHMQCNGTALHDACREGKYVVVAEKLIRNGADVNIRCTDFLSTADVSMLFPFYAMC
jgi:hypothetical protein